MIRDQDRYHTFSRRAVLLAAGKLTLFSGLAARMYYLQVIEADRYKMLAEDNRINMRLLAPPRGIISDRYGVEIATNQQNYQLIIVPERSPNIAKTLARIAFLVSCLNIVLFSCLLSLLSFTLGQIGLPTFTLLTIVMP